jgi:hypothetical protein
VTFAVQWTDAFAGPDQILVALDKNSEELLHVQPLSGIEDDLELRMELLTT